MGHAEAFAIGDVVARYLRLQGYDVLHPIGWDSFGLPAENAAIQRNAHPAEWTYANIETQASSFRRYGLSFDWSRRLHTSDPEYYRWTQWLFLRFRERGLAYRKASYVNWCPKDQTVLANEQVVPGHVRALRHGGDQAAADPVVLQDHRLRPAAAGRHGRAEGGWPDRVLAMQRNWIGRSEGAYVDFAIEGRDEPVTVFTTRPDTLYGATFFVVAPEAPLAAEIVADDQRAGVRGLPGADQAGHRDRAAGHRPAEDRGLPGRARGQPGQRRADPGLRRRLRAGRVRHRRDHGRAGARPARPGLRPGLRPARPRGGRHRRPTTRRRPGWPPRATAPTSTPGRWTG